jgi:predicted ATPase
MGRRTNIICPVKLTRVKIEQWRNFRAVDINVPADASLVSLVGENGTGKSNILEFIAAACVTFGLATGAEQRRGDPFAEPHEAEFVLALPPRYGEGLATQVLPDDVAGCLDEWDGTLILQTKRDDAGPSSQVYAGGLPPGHPREWLASTLLATLRQEHEIYHVYLDADRSYPPVPIAAHVLADSWTQPYESTDWNKQWAWRATRTLFEEWMKYFLSLETKTATRFLAATRDAQQQGAEPPVFQDPFAEFASSVKAVLPHLSFRGVDTENRTIAFDTSGTPLTFDRLSGGEREISFLIGQVERFQLRRGLFLIDEPELHLNPDLVRIWVAFLRDTVTDGQVWIATHSLEAVEVAGPAATFVLEREPETRTVVRADPLSARPVISALSSALGSPAFSISQRRFVYVEGERRARERERYQMVVDNPSESRFIEAGTGKDVIRSVAVLRVLAAESDEPLRVGGVLDRDFTTDEEADDIEAREGVHVLRAHEIENLFLHPPTLGVLLARSGRVPEEALDIIRATSDRFAGMWILQAAVRRAGIRDVRSELRALAGSKAWGTVETDSEATLASLVQAHHDGAEHEALSVALEDAVEAYRGHRDTEDLWKVCLGKQTLGAIAAPIGMSGQLTVERSVGLVWANEAAAVPDEVATLRAYVGHL